MSTLSAVLRPASGLENATIGERIDCSKEKMVSGAKFAVAQGAIAGVGTAGILQALNSDKFAKTISNAADKVVTKGAKEKIKDAANTLIESAKKNPAAAKAIAVIGGATILLGSIVSLADIRNNGKIEGKHQQKVDQSKN